MKRFVLAIETAGTHLGLSLHDAGDARLPAVARFFKQLPGRQAELLIPTLEKLLSSRRVRRSQIDWIVVDHGPGSFTGVRIGVATARALAQAFKISLVGVSGLEAMAWAAADKPGVYMPRMPAVAGECYHAAYERTARGWKELAAPAWTRDDEFEAALRRRPGATVVALGPSRPAPAPEGLVAVAVHRFGLRPRGPRFHFEKVVPVYLQPSWAERKLNKTAAAKA